MTEQEKRLLLADLCSRLPYGIKCTTKLTSYNDVYVVQGVYEDNVFIDCPVYEEGDDEWMIESIIPFLRPMSSMTEEEFGFLQEHLPYDFTRVYSDKFDLIDDIHIGNSVSIDDMAFLLDCLNKWHLDYRGLIPMGLALEALEGMYATHKKITCDNCENNQYCSQSEYVKKNCYKL